MNDQELNDLTVDIRDELEAATLGGEYKMSLVDNDNSFTMTLYGSNKKVKVTVTIS